MSAIKTKTAGERLTEERGEIAAKMTALVNEAKSTGRDLTTDEKHNTRAWTHRLEEIDNQLTEMKASDELMKSLAAAGAGSTGPGDRERIGAAGFDFADVKHGLAAALNRKSAYAFDLPLTKAAITAGPLDLPATGTDVADTPPGDTVVALRELLTTQRAESGNVRYYRIGRGSGADVVPEGGLKPELTTDITPVNGELLKIAVRFTYTDELAEDANFLVSYIARESTRSVLQRENELIAAALEDVDGALESTGTKADALDVLAGAIGAAQATNGLTPTRIVANPLDVAEIRTHKASGSGEYAIDPLSSQTTSVHGVPIVATPAVAAGRMYLVSPGVGYFYTRTGTLRVETGFAQGDWEHNRVTSRVEERVLPAITQPALLTRVTLTED